MKLIVSSDYHLDHVTSGVARFDEIVMAVNETIEAAIQGKAEAWLFLGDAMDPDSGACVFRCMKVLLDAAMRLAAAGIPSIFISGNHDVVEDSTGCTTLTPLRSLYNVAFASSSISTPGRVHLFERPGHVELPNGRIVVAMPFTATSHPYDPEKVEIPLGAITLTHLAVPGVVPGEETNEMPRGREVVFPTALVKPRASAMFAGHYHRQQTTPDGISIPGSLCRLTFGEEGHAPSFLIAEIH